MKDTRYIFLIYCLIVLLGSCHSTDTKKNSGQKDPAGNEYSAMNARLAKGWNTWNTYSVLSHVLLPESFAINLRLISHQSGDTLKEALIGRGDYTTNERVIPGPHAWL